MNVPSLDSSLPPSLVAHDRMTEDAEPSVSILGSLDVRPRAPRRLRRRVWLALFVVLGGVLAAQLMSINEVPDLVDVPSESGLHRVTEASIAEVQALADPAPENPARAAAPDAGLASPQKPAESNQNEPVVEFAVIRDLSPVPDETPLAATGTVVPEVVAATPRPVDIEPVPAVVRPTTAKVSRTSERSRVVARSKRSEVARPVAKVDDARDASDADVDIITAIVRSAAR